MLGQHRLEQLARMTCVAVKARRPQGVPRVVSEEPRASSTSTGKDLTLGEASE